MSAARVVSSALLVVAASCRAHRGEPAMPYIESITPDSVALASGSVIEVVIKGRGFAPGTPGTNTIEFAGASIGQVPANDAGTEVRFVVPDVVNAGGEAAPHPLMGGAFTVRIVTRSGASNKMTLKVSR